MLKEWKDLRDEISRSISGTAAGVTGPGATSTEILFLACIEKCGTDLYEWSKVLDSFFKYDTDFYLAGRTIKTNANYIDETKELMKYGEDVTKVLYRKARFEKYIKNTIGLIEDPDISNMLLYLNSNDYPLYKAVATWRLAGDISGVSGIQDNRLSDPSDEERCAPDETI